MATLAVGMYDEFVSDTLQPELVELRVLDENEVDLVSGQSVLLLELLVLGLVIGIGVGFIMNRDPPYNPPQPPLPRRPFVGPPAPVDPEAFNRQMQMEAWTCSPHR
jgi:hypothetical protein